MTVTNLTYEVTAVLERSSAEIEGPLRAAVAQLPAELWRGAAFHFGWRDADGRKIVAKQGKMVRPAFTLAAARAVNGGRSTPAAHRAGVAVELVHNFSLVHDDVMDADELRRGRPTVWARFGTPFAILLGDALLALASQVLTQEGGGHDAARLCAELSEMTVTLCRGQLQDMAFEVLPVVSVEDYLEMAAGKTAALLSGACVLGGMAGGGSETQVKALRGFGYHLGLAFQLVDDVLGIWGEPAVTGKPAGADLLRYKKSMPVLCALSSTSKAEDELAELYRQRAIAGPRELALAVKLVECAGGRERTEAEAAKQLQLALRCIDDLSGDPLALHDLKELAALMVDRNR